MSTPNLLTCSSITFDRDDWAATNSLTTRVTAGASETVVIFSITACNITPSTPGWIAVVRNSSSTDFHEADQITVPANSTVQCLDKPLVLNPGDLCKLQVNASSAIETQINMIRIS